MHKSMHDQSIEPNVGIVEMPDPRLGSNKRDINFNFTKAKSGFGVRSQFRTTLFPAKNNNKRNCALTPKPLLPG